MPQQQKNFIIHFVDFCRELREQGFSIGIKEMNDSLEGLRQTDLLNVQQVKLTLRTILCSNKKEQEQFERFFERFFEKKCSDNMLHVLTADHVNDNVLVNHQEKIQQTTRKKDDWLPEDEQHASEESRTIDLGFTGHEKETAYKKEETEMSLFAAIRMLQKKTREIAVPIPEDNFETMERAAKQWFRQIQLIDSRRKKVMRNGKMLDMRKTLRQSIQYGGYPVKPIWIGPKKSASQFILLCDSSRSMASYIELYVQFAYALKKCDTKTKVYLFSSSLRDITEQLTSTTADFYPVLHVDEAEWKSGTRISESLAQFIQQEGNTFNRQKTVVFIASDGLDAGSGNDIKTVMQEIRNKAALIVWLNPLLNIKGYQPSAKAMKMALPYIDIFSGAVQAEDLLLLANRASLRR